MRETEPVTFNVKLLQGGLATLLLFAGLGFALYFQTVSFDYTDLDDRLLIEENRGFLKDLSNIHQAFKQTVFNTRPNDGDVFYRPVLTLSLMLDEQFSSGTIKAYHLSNIAYHVLATWLLFILLLKLGYKNGVSLFLSLIFLLHPAFATAVAWIPGRNDVLLGVFTILSLITFLNYQRNGKPVTLALHAACFLLCLFTKETAMLLPLLFFVFMLALEKANTDGKKTPATRAHFFLPAAMWVGAIAVYQLMRYQIIQPGQGANPAIMIEHFSQNAPVLLQYIGKIFFPFNLSTYPKMEDTTFLFGLLSTPLLFLLFKKRAVGSSFFWAGVSWFIFFLLPSGTIAENALEHRLYLPMMGSVLLLSENSWIRKLDFTSSVIKGMCAAILLLLGTVTYIHSRHFRDADAFWKKASQTSPSSATVHMHMGVMHQLKKKFGPAAAEYKKAIALDPAMRHLNNNLGKIYLDTQQHEEAEKCFLRELAIQPDEVTYYNLFSLREQQGRLPEAKEFLVKALELKPNYTDALNDLGTLYGMEKKYDEALKLFHRATAADPGYVLAHKNIVLIYLVQKENEKAMEYYRYVKDQGLNVQVQQLEESR